MRPRVFVLLLLCLAGGIRARAATSFDREMVLTPPEGAAPEDVAIRRWQARVAAPDATASAIEQLGWAYVAKARRTLDPGFFKLAEKCADVMDASGVTPESRLLRGHVQHNLHQFAAAEGTAAALVEERGLPVDFALWSDALVEQGKIAAAIPVLQRLVDLKPGVEAFSRIGHVRWLKGDLAGAIAALDLAWNASAEAEPETQAWLLVRLSVLQLQRGDLALARRLAERASERLTDFPPALLARGRVLLAQGERAAAIEVLRRAEELSPLPEYQWWLSEALAAGDPAAAAAVQKRLLARGAENDPRTLAIFLASEGRDGALALRLARAELAHRADAFTYDALAWAEFAAGDVKAAADAMKQALAEGCTDARLQWHAGEIARATGAPDWQRHFELAHAGRWTLTPSERARLDAASPPPTASAAH